MLEVIGVLKRLRGTICPPRSLLSRLLPRRMSDVMLSPDQLWDVYNTLTSVSDELNFLLRSVMWRVNEEIASIEGYSIYLSSFPSPPKEIDTLLPCLKCWRAGSKFHYLKLKRDKLVCSNLSSPLEIDVTSYRDEIVDFIHFLVERPNVVPSLVVLWMQYISSEENPAKDAEFSVLFSQLALQRLSPASVEASALGFVTSAIIYLLQHPTKIQRFLLLLCKEDVASALVQKLDTWWEKTSPIVEKINEVEYDIYEQVVGLSRGRKMLRRLYHDWQSLLMSFIQDLSDEEFELLVEYLKAKEQSARSVAYSSSL